MQGRKLLHRNHENTPTQVANSLNTVSVTRHNVVQALVIKHVSRFTGLSPCTMAQIPTRQRILASQNLWKHEGLVTTHQTSMRVVPHMPLGPSSSCMVPRSYGQVQSPL